MTFRKICETIGGAIGGALDAIYEMLFGQKSRRSSQGDEYTENPKMAGTERQIRSCASSPRNAQQSKTTRPEPLRKDVFYIESIHELFQKYDVDISSMGAFDVLCTKIEHQAKCDLYKRLSEQLDPKSMIQLYNQGEIHPPEFRMSMGSRGQSLSGEYMTAFLKQLNLESQNTGNVNRNAQIVLRAHYARGVEWVFQLFGEKLERLLYYAEQGKNADAATQFENIVKEAKIQLSLYR